MPEPSTLDTTIAGSWYLPATPEHAVGGKLHVQPDGRTLLEVAGALDDAAGAWKQPRSEALIYGVGTDGTFYSLFDNKLTSSRHGISPDDKSGAFPDRSEYSQYVWHVSYYTDGPDFIDDKSEIPDIRVSLSVLQDWMAKDDKLESVGKERRQSRLTIPQEHEYVCDVDGASIILCDRFKYSATRYKTNLTYAPYFQVAGSSTTIGRVVSDWMLPIQRLMMFLSSYYAHITEVHLRRKDSESPVTLNLQMTTASVTNPTHMFLYFYLHRADLERMGVPLEDIIKNWFQLEDDYPYLAELFGSLASSRYYYDDAIMLLLFRAVESFHAQTMESRKVPQEKHRDRVRQTVAHIPSGVDRKWAREILGQSNSKGLSAVMYEFLGRCGQIGDLILQRYPKFVPTAVALRGKIAHTVGQDKVESVEKTEVCFGLVWLARRIATERLLNSAEAADDYISNNWIFKSYLGET